MKSDTLVNLNLYIGILTAFAFIIPALVVILRNKMSEWSFLALGLNYLFTFAYNTLSTGLFPVSKIFLSYLGIFNNLIDAPLLLLFLIYFMEDGPMKNTVKKIIPLFVLFGLVTFFIMGRTKETITIVSGPGIAVILFYIIPIFVKKVQEAVGQRKGTGGAFMTASVLFGYTCYSVIYLLFYVFNSEQKTDILIMYNLASLIATLLMVIGLLLEKPELTIPENKGVDRISRKMVFPDWDELPLR